MNAITIESAALLAISRPYRLGTAEHHRSQASSCWHQARQLRKFVAEHDWHMSADDIERSLEMAADLRKDAYEHLLQAKRAL